MNSGRESTHIRDPNKRGRLLLLRVYRDQVYSPKTFAFRVVLPEATLTTKLRITIDQPVPGFDFMIREARLYTTAP